MAEDTNQATTTGRAALARLLLPSDRLDVSPEGMLRIDGYAADALLERFGSPLVVVSETSLRENYRRIRRAFAERWGAAVNVMYAIKSNT